MDIKVTLVLGGQVQRLEEKALVDHDVQRNWISQKLAQQTRLEIQPLPKDVASESWNGRQLVSLGFITFAWRRSEISNPTMFESEFYVSADGSIPMLIGHELLSKKRQIENPSDPMLVNVVSPRKSKSTPLLCLPNFYYQLEDFRVTDI